MFCCGELSTYIWWISIWIITLRVASSLRSKFKGRCQDQSKIKSRKLIVIKPPFLGVPDAVWSEGTAWAGWGMVRRVLAGERSEVKPRCGRRNQKWAELFWVEFSPGACMEEVIVTDCKWDSDHTWQISSHTCAVSWSGQVPTWRDQLSCDGETNPAKKVFSVLFCNERENLLKGWKLSQELAAACPILYLAKPPQPLSAPRTNPRRTAVPAPGHSENQHVLPAWCSSIRDPDLGLVPQSYQPGKQSKPLQEKASKIN